MAALWYSAVGSFRQSGVSEGSDSAVQGFLFHHHARNCLSNLFFQLFLLSFLLLFRDRRSHRHQTLTSSLTNKQKKGVCMQTVSSASALIPPFCVGVQQLSRAAVCTTCRGQRPYRRGQYQCPSACPSGAIDFINLSSTEVS